MKVAVLLRAIDDPELAAGVIGTTWRLDDPSLVALAQALAMRSDGPVTATGIAVGPAAWDAPLREALGLGLDDVRRAWSDDGSPADVLDHATAIAEIMPPGTDLVIAGSASSDTGSGVLGAAVAGLLGCSFVDDVTSVRSAGTHVLLQARAPGGRRLQLRAPLPAVVCCARGSAPALVAPVARRLAARRRPVPVTTAAAVGDGDGEPRYTFAGYGPARPLTRRLLKPDASANSGARLRQLMSGGAGGGAKKALSEGDLAGQLADFLVAEGFVG